jgi:HSP20 family protein
MQPLRQEMDELFHRFFGSAPGNGSDAMQAWAPSVDVEETDKEIVVKADLPGVDPKDIDINYHRVERFFGQFYREIPLPAGADADKVVASSTKGVISISIPKKPEAQPKKIVVKAQE